MRHFLPTLIVLLLLTEPTEAQDLEKGREARKQGDYPAALQELLPLAEQGDPEAQFLIAGMLMRGHGVSLSVVHAAQWLMMAAEQDHVSSQSVLGIIYRNGLGRVPVNPEQAAKWYRAAAEKGDPLSQYQLGTMHSEGEGVLHDEKEAVKWIRRAAEQNFPRAQNELGARYEKGIGLHHYYIGSGQDYSEALSWYRRSAEQGFAAAQNNLGRMYKKGKGVGQHYMLAHKWFNLAARNGNPEAAKNRDLIAEKMTLDQISEAQELAREWIEQHQ